MGRCASSVKAWLIVVLAVGFAAQTFFVYADSTESVQLDERAIAGRQVWLAHNCQACHQLHGFGGFLGPDLTNAASRIESSILTDRLANGKGQMPSFDLQPDEVADLWAFLESMDRTGIGQARSLSQRAVGAEALEHLSPEVRSLKRIIDESGDANISFGLEVFQTASCRNCHVLYGVSAFDAPDLSLTSRRRSPGGVSQVLEFGLPPKMPPADLSAEQRAAVVDFILFMGEHREETLANVTSESIISYWLSLPWWEYE